jgi:ADP-heptose:LPS heptosyltransferase
MVLFTGTAGEWELIARIQAEMGTPARGFSHSLAGRLDLGEMAALLAQAPLLISNNTGPVHMAAALGTPVVVLYALTNPQHTPWLVRSHVLSHDVPCKYCYKSVCPLVHNNCLRLIAPELVIEAAGNLLAESGSIPAPSTPQPPSLEAVR